MRWLTRFILIPGLLLSGACETEKIYYPSDPNALAFNTDSNLSKDHLQIRSLTDRILVALATKNHTQLKQFFRRHDQTVSGRQAARILLGTYADTAIIQRWDAQTFQITIDENALNATASGVVVHKITPNRQATKSHFTFQFSRHTPDDPWTLFLNRP